MRERKLPELTGQIGPLRKIRDAIEVAHEKVEDTIQNHHPKPLENIQKAELTRILAIADWEIGGENA